MRDVDPKISRQLQNRVRSKQAIAAVLGLMAVLEADFAKAAYDARDKLSQVSVFEAIDRMTDDLSTDLAELSKVTQKTSIVNYTQSEELPPSTLNYLTKKIELKTGRPRSPVRFVQCLECTTLRAVADGKDIVVKKGISSDQELNQVLGQLHINEYSEVNLAFSGQYLAMQVSLYNKNKETAWAKEYRAPYRNHADWTASLEIGAVGYMKPGLEMGRAVRAELGQMLYGLGAAGVSVTAFEPHPILGPINTFAGFIDVSHNEIFEDYWTGLQLYYVGEMGVTDFNGKQQIMYGLGTELVFGDVFKSTLYVRNHTFIQRPTDDSDIYNPAGESVLKNNEVLPTQILIGIGFSFI